LGNKLLYDATRRANEERMKKQMRPKGNRESKLQERERKKKQETRRKERQRK
jgi:hypothetical protein